MQTQSDELFDIPKAIWNQKKLISLVTLFGSAIGLLLATNYSPSNHETLAKIMQLGTSNPTRILSAKRTEPAERDKPPTWQDIEGKTHKTIILNNYLEMATSPEMLNFVIKKLGLNKERSKNFKTLSDLKKMISQRIRVAPIISGGKKGTFMEITVKGNNPELIAKIANIIVDEIINKSKQEEKKVTEDIEKRLKVATDFLKSQVDLSPFPLELDFPFSKAYGNSKLEFIASLNNQISKYQIQWKSIDLRLESAKNSPDSPLLKEQITMAHREMQIISNELLRLINVLTKNNSELESWKNYSATKYSPKEDFDTIVIATYQDRLVQIKKLIHLIPLKLKVLRRAEIPIVPNPSPILVNTCFAAITSFELAIFMAILLDFWKMRSRVREQSSIQSKGNKR